MNIGETEWICNLCGDVLKEEGHLCPQRQRLLENMKNLRENEYPFRLSVLDRFFLWVNRRTMGK